MLPTDARAANKISLANLDQWSLRVTGDTGEVISVANTLVTFNKTITKNLKIGISLSIMFKF